MDISQFDFPAQTIFLKIQQRRNTQDNCEIRNFWKSKDEKKKELDKKKLLFFKRNSQWFTFWIVSKLHFYTNIYKGVNNKLLKIPLN